MRAVWTVGILVAAAVALGACRPLGVAPARDAIGADPGPSSAPSRLRVGLPEWWQDEPTEEGGVVTVCAMADSDDLASARRAAIDVAERLFREATGGAASDPEVQTDSVRRGDGGFRAYVRLSGRAESAKSTDRRDGGANP